MSDFSQRTLLLLGETGVRKLAAAHVLIAGLGAVGSFAAEACARAGVGQLTLADFDVVSESNINRQLFALHSTVGQKKTGLALARIKDINPACRVIVREEFIDPQNISGLLASGPDVVLDAIDTFNSKLALISHCAANGITQFSSMGAARKSDVTRIKVSAIQNATHCPLARKLRITLKKNGVTAPVQCVWSDEEPANCAAAPEETRDGTPRRTFGSLCAVTGIFGLTLAGLAIKHIVAKE
ncbi:MAG: tRNA threonylcarbamoyladenosine dehydratase [Elusimicrobiaceae bacterium]|nr:tRNA threonylcarbamoyladenosine dehydratase [Elusimicrobiaceae bacterium]